MKIFFFSIQTTEAFALEGLFSSTNLPHTPTLSSACQLPSSPPWLPPPHHSVPLTSAGKVLFSGKDEEKLEKKFRNCSNFVILLNTGDVKASPEAIIYSRVN